MLEFSVWEWTSNTSLVGVSLLTQDSQHKVPCACLDRLTALFSQLKKTNFDSNDISLDIVLRNVRSIRNEWTQFQLCHRCYCYPDPDMIFLFTSCGRIPLRQLRCLLSAQSRVIERQPHATGQSRTRKPICLGTYQMTAEEEDAVASVLLERALSELQQIFLEIKRLSGLDESRQPCTQWSNALQDTSFPLTANAPESGQSDSSDSSLYAYDRTLLSLTMVGSSWSPDCWPRNIDIDSAPNSNIGLNLTPLQQIVALAITECQELTAIIAYAYGSMLGAG